MNTQPLNPADAPDTPHAPNPSDSPNSHNPPEQTANKTATAPASSPPISCDVCRDLMPLVQDGVASDDSAALVRAHTEACADCRALMENGNFSAAAPDVQQQADASIIRRLRQTLLLRSGLFALVGVVGGLLLTANGSGSVYIMWWLPLIGAASYFVMRRRWWLAPLMVGALIALGNLTMSLLRGNISLDFLMTWPVTQGVAWAVYTAVGTALGALLRFALGKDKG